MIIGLFCFTAGQASSQTFEDQVAGVSAEAENAWKVLAASPGSEKGPLIGIEWVSIPGGTFKMGSDNGHSDEKPVHKVTLKGFEMSKTEVTVEQYKACVDAGKCSKPGEGSNFNYCNWGVSGRKKHPINCVGWHQAVTFAEWAGGRLPSEAEWEYAARSAGKDQTYPWGNDKLTCGKAVTYFGGGNCGLESTLSACSKTSGNTEQGLCDMAGNVWEWVQDTWHDSYDGAPSDGSAWTDTGSYRVVRGGSWNDSDAGSLRSADRGGVVPVGRGNGLGLRVVRSRR